MSQTLGGAELWPGRTLSRIEPHGVVRFDPGSRTVQAQEPEDREREVNMPLLGNVVIHLMAAYIIGNCSAIGSAGTFSLAFDWAVSI